MKRIYDPREAKDGTRVLVMRLWPRGVKKGHADLWLKELGPRVPVLKAWKAGTISWSDFRRRYVAGLKEPAARQQLKTLRSMAGKGRITLLCACVRDG